MFNVNEHVRVRLTDLGRAELRRQREELIAYYDAKGATGVRAMLASDPVPAEDAAGWSEWQLWQLMSSLGPLCGNGLPLAFETTIEIIPPQPLCPLPSLTECD